MALLAYLSVGDGATSDYLNLTDTAKHFILENGVTFGAPGEISLALLMVGATPDAMAENYQNIVANLRHAETAAREQATSERVTLTWQDGTTNPVYFDVLSGTLTPGRVLSGGRHSEAMLTLICLPWARGAAITDTVTATLTNGSAQWLRADVPGDHPALCKLTIVDVSSAGIINRIRIAARTARNIAALGDFDPWVDAAILAPGTNAADATAFGGGYTTTTITATAFANLSRSVMPAGVLNKGKRDIWARVFDSATAMAAPTSLTAPVTAPVTTNATEAMTIEEIQTATARVTSGTTISPTWGAPTTLGNLLVLVVLQQLTDTPLTPSGWTLAKSVGSLEAGNLLDIDVWYIKNAAVRSGGEVVSGLATATAGDPATAYLLEFSGAYAGTGNAILAALSSSDTTDLSIIPIVGNDTAFVGQGTLAIVGTAGTATASRLDYWQGGLSEVAGGNEILIGLHRADSVGQVISTNVNLLAAAASFVRVVLSIRPGTESATTYVQPTPGTLVAGSYGFRVQAVDPVGTLSNATGTTTAVVATDNSSIALAWTAPSGTKSYYKVTYQLAGRFYYFFTPDNAVAYTMTSPDGHAETGALPVTAGATAPPARMKARIGTVGTDTALLSDLPEVILTGNTRWEHVKLASGVDLPPVGEFLAGTRPEWAIETQVRTVNGLSATVRIDALWLAPHDEPQATIEYPGLGLATLRRWVVETDRSGRSMTGYVENIGTSVESGRVTCAGAFVLPPGDAIIALLLDQLAPDISTLTAAVTVLLTIYPRYEWVSS